MRSLISSKMSFGTTFLATSSPFTRYGRLLTIRSATSWLTPSVRTKSVYGALLIFSKDTGGAAASTGPPNGFDDGADFAEDAPPDNGAVNSAGAEELRDRERSFISF